MNNIPDKFDALVACYPNNGWGRYDADTFQNLDGIEIDEDMVSAKLAELIAAEPMRLLRIERNRLLQETDWRFRSDLTPSQAWIDYCQALRDLPENSEPQLDENGELTNVTWPEKPE